jgi:hypothetical protein
VKTAPPRSSSTSSPSRLEDIGPALAGQCCAAVGAVLALLGPFSTVVSGIGVALLILGVVLSAPEAKQPGPVLADWWNPLALGALACLIGFGLAFWIAAPGGVILTAGAIAALTAVFLGARG